ncbi:hypothetical protein DY000_02060755 [Brassica cretica]|uniref:Uncharacterized protein n=1 Tax=Brassica cretica TaxID=69181 RepID=A0ABQ7AS58_BRACR|nr:hypothetical protein DY000_02060755 [Brassica cretica]
MANFNLASLPPSKLHKILSKIRSMLLEHSGLSATNWVIQKPSTYGMMNLAFSVDHRGLVHNYPDFTHEYVDRMYHMINSWALSGHWGYSKPEMFMSLLERIDPNVCYDCWSSAIIGPVFVLSIDGSRTRWKCDRSFLQCAAWNFCNEIHLTARDWPIGD